MNVSDASHAFAGELFEALRVAHGIEARGINVDIIYDSRRLAHKVRLSACWGGRAHEVTAMLGGLIMQHIDARHTAINDIVNHPDLVIPMYFDNFPSKVMPHVSRVEYLAEKDMRRVVFANGHYVDMDNRRRISEYDHANMLMVYDLPPR